MQVLQSGVGGITESDIILAHASGAAVIGFNVRADKLARERAKRDGVEIRYYNIIYNVVDDVKAVLSGMLAPELREKFLGNAEILEVFTITKVGKVAGCRVTEGVVRRGAKVRLIRDNVVIHEGELSTLKRFKDEVREVQNGQECGMAFTNYQDMQKGDVIEALRGRNHPARALSVALSGSIVMSRRHSTSATQGPSQRQLRVGEMLRHALAQILVRGEIRDPDLEGVSVTVTQVKPSPDMRHATVFVEPLGGKNAKQIVAALNRHKAFLRGEMGHMIDLKFTPDLRFIEDESFAEAQKIEDILKSDRVQRDLKIGDDDGA